MASAIDRFRICPTAQKMKLSIKDFFSKCDQIRSWSHLLKKCVMEKFIFCAVPITMNSKHFCSEDLKFLCKPILTSINIATLSLRNLLPLEIFNSKPNKTSLQESKICFLPIWNSGQSSMNFSWVSRLLSTQSIKHIASSLLETSKLSSAINKNRLAIFIFQRFFSVFYLTLNFGRNVGLHFDLAMPKYRALSWNSLIKSNEFLVFVILYQKPWKNSPCLTKKLLLFLIFLSFFVRLLVLRRHLNIDLCK